MKNDLQTRAINILRENDRGGFTVPTAGLYPYQWNWDSVFVALGFSTFDEARACEEIETLLEAQWEDGFIPHIVFRQEDPDYFPGPDIWNAGAAWPSSGITQPPVAASVVNRLWNSVSDDEVKERLVAMFPRLLAWHRWFFKFRVPGEIGAVVITHPWESGRDNSPEWDVPAANIDVSGVKPYQRRDLQHVAAQMRPTKLDYDRYIALIEYGRDTGWNHEAIPKEGPFRVADVGTTMILLRATRDLMQLAENLGKKEAIVELAGHLKTLEDGINYLWDDEARTFCCRDAITGVHSGLVTNTSFLYAYAGVGSIRQRECMAEHWRRIAAESLYMMPSLDPQYSRFDHLRYWRGPIWIVINKLLADGFRENGLDDWALRLEQDSRDLIIRYGFSEAFSPTTGEGSGGADFSWTAAMWLYWCGKI